eukprot:2521525-Rhodomonas_salina.1
MTGKFGSANDGGCHRLSRGPSFSEVITAPSGLKSRQGVQLEPLTTYPGSQFVEYHDAVNPVISVFKRVWNSTRITPVADTTSGRDTTEPTTVRRWRFCSSRQSTFSHSNTFTTSVIANVAPSWNDVKINLIELALGGLITQTQLEPGKASSSADPSENVP